MSTDASVSEPLSVVSYIEDGARIAAILFTWSAIASFFVYGLAEAGIPFERLWFQVGQLLAVTGVFNAVLYILYRAIDYWHTLN